MHRKKVSRTAACPSKTVPIVMDYRCCCYGYCYSSYSIIIITINITDHN
jgi:hypothetical protein